jgi:hypothetical protein
MLETTIAAGGQLQQHNAHHRQTKEYFDDSPDHIVHRPVG